MGEKKKGHVGLSSEKQRRRLTRMTRGGESRGGRASQHHQNGRGEGSWGIEEKGKGKTLHQVRTENPSQVKRGRGKEFEDWCLGRQRGGREMEYETRTEGGMRNGYQSNYSAGIVRASSGHVVGMPGVRGRRSKLRRRETRRGGDSRTGFNGK